MRRTLTILASLVTAAALAACTNQPPTLPGQPSTPVPVADAPGGQPDQPNQSGQSGQPGQPTAPGIPIGLVDPADTTTVLPEQPALPPPTSGKPFLQELIDWCARGELAACDRVTGWADSAEVKDFGATCGYRLAGIRELLCTEHPSHLPGYGEVGSDTLMDTLVERCHGGEVGACDQLLIAAKMNSGYAREGATCGRGIGPLQGVDDFCAIEDPATFPGYYGRDANLDRLFDSCVFDDMAACDELYYHAPASSLMQDFGRTCGAIFNTDHYEWCDPASEELYQGAGSQDGPQSGGTSGPTTPNPTTPNPIPITGATAPGTTAPTSPKPYVQHLIDACAVGQMASCGYLSWWDDGPDIEHFAITCGGWDPDWETATAGCVTVPSPIPNYGDSGTDVRLDHLMMRCMNADLEACDMLNVEAPLGSEYSQVAFACGGDTEAEALRGESNWCMGAVPRDLKNYFESDPELDALWQQCMASDMAACDELFVLAPPSSNYAQFGGTCGGLYFPGHDQWCSRSA
ncbi:MAG TPA: hypothetical protein GX743_03275 [Actinomycetales bacterium]|nr:hypothetical protein [Actinomycetales bacterium]